MSKNNDFRNNTLSNQSLENYEQEIEQDTTEHKADVPIEYMSLDLASAMDELNHERDAMYLANEPILSSIVELNQEMIQNHIKKYGIANFLELIRDSIWRAGYIKQEQIQLLHKKSGVYIKF